MKMLFLWTALLVTTSLSAQSMKEDVDFIQSAYGMSKKDLVSEYMNLSGDKGKAFWSMYDQYENDRKAIGRDRMKLIGDYASSLDNMTDDKANTIAKTYMKNNMAMDKLFSKYYGKFSKILGGRDAAKFMQLEDYLNTSMKSSLQEALPFIGQKDKKM